MKMKIMFAVVTVAILFATVMTPPANAATVSDNIGVTGNFDATLGGSGTATLNSASGTFRQWLLFAHANINVTANAQTVGINIPTVGPLSMPADGNIGLDFDNLTPGTPQTVTSVNADLNGNFNIGYGINVAPIAISTSLGNFNLNLTIAGDITDIDFVSTGPGTVIGGNGGVFAAPGDFSITLNGNVNAQLTGVPILGTVNLGTITTIPSTTLPFSAFIPGTVNLSDLQGGVGPFPNDMLALFQSIALPPISVPLSLPLTLNQTATIPNGQSGFSVLNVDAVLDAQLDLSNVSYSLSGTSPQVLVVPEPTSGMFLATLVAGAGAVIRRRRG